MAVALAASVAGALTGACGGGTTGSAGTVARCVRTHVRVGGRTVTVPVEPGCVRIAGGTGSGNQVILTTQGFEPFHLLADPKARITFTNLTDAPRRITFEYSPVRSGAIPPGGSWTWQAPSLVALAYDADSGAHGELDVGALP